MHNEKRKARMEARSDSELVKFVLAKTLSSAAAFYQLKKRGKLAMLAGKK